VITVFTIYCLNLSVLHVDSELAPSEVLTGDGDVSSQVLGHLKSV